MKDKNHLPVFIDPSHAAGSWKLVWPLSLSSLASGADDLMTETHPNSGSALSDGKQSLRYDKFEALIKEINTFAAFLNGNIRTQRVLLYRNPHDGFHR